MYEIAKSVILSGDFELSEMLMKLDKLSFKDQITEEQHVELANLAREHADQTMSMDIIKRLEDHEIRLRAIEKGGAVEPPAPGKYPEFVEKKSAAYNEDKFMWKGKIYQCTLPDYVEVCYVSPDAYPAYWKEVTE